MQSTVQKSVRTRRVFYIPGYDPNPPRRYRELFRTQSLRQAEISKYEITSSLRASNGTYGWQATAVIDHHTVTSHFEVLSWSDVVQKSMSASIFWTYIQLFTTAWIYLSSGALGRLIGLRKGPMIAALYPVVMLLGQLVVAILIALLFRGITAQIMNAWISGVASALIFVVVLKMFKSLDGKLYAYYLMHDYAFTAKFSGRNPEELGARLQEFQGKISKALCSDTDEVLVIGHSSGAHLAVNILAKILGDQDTDFPDGKLAFLSLGQVIPMVSFLPYAHQLRADLRALSVSDRLCWVDVSAPGDGCSFALCDPVAVSGVVPDNQRWPVVVSAAFTQTLSEARWKELRWRFFRLHFQYLCAFDQPADYDYFQITTGPKTLAQRFNHRASSPSTIRRPVSKFRSVYP